MKSVVIGVEDAEIIDLEEQMRVAQMAGDVAALSRLIADDLLFAGPDGQLATKAQDLDGYRAGTVKFKAHEPEELRVRRMRPDIAVASLSARLEIEVSGKMYAGRYRYTRVWARGPDGQWRVAAGHVSSMPAR